MGRRLKRFFHNISMFFANENDFFNLIGENKIFSQNIFRSFFVESR